MRKSAFQYVADSFIRKTSPACPHKRKAPKGAKMFKVPLEFRGALARAEEFGVQAEKILRKRTLPDGREWLWEAELRDAILTLVWEALQKKYGRPRSDHPHFYRGWEFEFMNTA